MAPASLQFQLAYRYAEPLSLPRGARLRATGWYDNSANNSADPDPSKTVRWGPQTADEMMLGYVEYYFPDEKPRRWRAVEATREPLVPKGPVKIAQPFKAGSDGPTPSVP